MRLRKRSLNIKFLVLIFFLSITSLVEAKIITPKKFVQIRNNLNDYYQKKIETELREFVKSGSPNRFVGSVGHENSLEYLKNSIKKYDPNASIEVEEFDPDYSSAIKLYQDDFDKEIKSKFSPKDKEYIKWKKFTDLMIEKLRSLEKKKIKGKNLIWTKVGKSKPDEVLVAGAHYDTILHNEKTRELITEGEMPGADDNASGVAILLQLISYYSQIEFEKTLKIVFFDFEEIGFLGSKAFVQNHKETFRKQKFLGYINLEMLGHDSKVLDTDKKFGNFCAYIRSQNEEEKNWAENLISVGQEMNSGVTFALVQNNFNLSDNINFWDENFPAITFSQNWEKDLNLKNYHTNSDLPETINFRTLHQSFLFIGGVITATVLDVKP